MLAGGTLALVIFATLTPAHAVKIGQKVPDFRLKDGFGKTYTLKSFRKPVLVIWYEGKNTKEQNRWIKTKLRRMYDTKVINQKKLGSFGIANFQESAIPNFLMRAGVRIESKKRKVVILCDDTGKMMKKWGFRNGRSNIYVLDKRRRLRWRSSGKLTRRRGNQLLRFILRLTRQQ